MDVERSVYCWICQQLRLLFRSFIYLITFILCTSVSVHAKIRPVFIDQEVADNLIAAREMKRHSDEFLDRCSDLRSTEIVLNNDLLSAGILLAEDAAQYSLSSLKNYRDAHLAWAGQIYTADGEVLRASMDLSMAQLKAETVLSELKSTRTAQKLRIQWVWPILMLVIGAGALFLFIWQKRMAVALDDSRRLAEQANASKSRFLAHVSYEMQAPLHIIIKASNTVANQEFGKLETDTYRTYAVAINQSARHLLSVINEIMTYSRIESGRFALNEEHVDLDVLLTDLMKDMTPGAELKGIKLSLSLAEDLPDLFADRGLVLQALENLVSNGIKFSQREGSVTVTCDITVDGTLRIVVSDNGCGMSDEDIVRALEPFEQAQSIFVRAHGGTGLGLPLADLFIRRHKGRLLVGSKQGNGTRLSIIFPRERLVPRNTSDRIDPDSNPKRSG